MNRTDVAYLINTTPRYFYLLPLHLRLIQRYAYNMKWPVYLATEVPTHPDIVKLCSEFPSLTIIPLTQDQEPFLESRLAATESLPESIKYVFPIQEDFLLEGRPMDAVIENGLEIMDFSNNSVVSTDEFKYTKNSVASIRLMPCPGPVGTRTWGDSKWRELGEEDSLIFTFQATLWRREAYAEYMRAVLKEIPEGMNQKQKIDIQIRQNIAENHTGQRIIRGMRAEDRGSIRQVNHSAKGPHLAWPREGSWPNAVYLSPWPYRPTAIVRGTLQQWAKDLAEREGVTIAYPASS
jgi:hypothetical protein